MKKTVFTLATLAAFTLSGTFVSAETTLQGAGASFPAPLYQRWAQDFNKQRPDIQINYQPNGSGAGVKQFTQGLVDFGASDAAMSDEEISKVAKGVVMIPATAGSIVLAYNLPGVTDLKLTRAAYAGIFLGTISKWNDAQIAKSNPGVKLPDTAITVCTRADGSGTTFVFTKHLSTISAEFKEKVGENKAVSWPTGVSGKGNDGVTALVQQTPGAIGYVEYGYAENNKLSMAALENKAGKFVKPTLESGTATLASVQLPENLRIWPADPAGEGDYPIATFTWLLLYKTYDNAANLTALKQFITYGLTEGQKTAPSLGYIPLPKGVVTKCQAALESVK
ncbi:MAG: phosphate ABC transporter substrate-binding protein PstS [Chthoniobacterales bacterium]